VSSPPHARCRGADDVVLEGPGCPAQHSRDVVRGPGDEPKAHDLSAIPLPGFRNQDQVEDNAGAIACGPLPEDQYEAVLAALAHQGTVR